VRVRREQGAYRAHSRGRYSLRAAALVALMALVFLLF